MEVIKLLFSYLFGSINFAYVIARLLKLRIEETFDENLGAYNLYRASNSLALAALAGVLDIIKVYLPAKLFGIWAGIAAYLGHAFSFWYMLKVKRIVSTGMGLSSILAIALAYYPELIAVYAFYMLIHFTIVSRLLGKELKLFGSQLYHSSYLLLALLTYLTLFPTDPKPLLAMGIIIFASFFFRWATFVKHRLLPITNKRMLKKLIEEKKGF